MEFNPLKYFTIIRFLNAIKILLSFYLSKFLNFPIVWGKPLTFSIEPTNYCNLQCPECPSGTGQLTRPAGLMQFDLFKRIVDDIKTHAFYIQLFHQGEPYLHKQLPNMIAYAKNNGLYVSVSTNGQVINEKNIMIIMENPPEKIIFSIDGLDEKSYQTYRVGGTFSKVDTGLKLLIRKKKELKKSIPFIELQFIVMKQNEHLIQKILEYGKQTGVNKVTLKSMQISSVQNAKKFLPENDKYRRYIIKNDEVKIKNRFRNSCFALWRTSVITWDGKIVPCCFDKDAQYELGNLSEKMFSQIWKSSEYYKFRMKILRNRKQVDICCNCTEGLKLNMVDF